MGTSLLPADPGLRLARARARGDIKGVLLRLPQTLRSHLRARKKQGRERGYVYFQEFLPGNEFDTRITVIGNRAFAFTRNVRKNDFRASGSGSIDHGQERVSQECLRVAFNVARKLGAQSVAFDFVVHPDGHPRILEVSFGYLATAVHACPGHWDENLRFVEGHTWPQDAIFDDLMGELERRGPR